MPIEPAPVNSRLAGFRQGLVAADVIRIGAGVDDVSNGLRRDPFDRGDDGIGLRGSARIHDDDAVLAHLDADVRARTGNHERN